MFLDAGGNGKDVRVKDDVFSREGDFLCQQFIGTGADFYFARVGISLTVFVKGHDDDSCTVLTAKSCLFEKGFFAFLHRDGVNDTLALYTFKASFNNVPFRRIDHNRNFAYVRFGANQVEELNHHLF
ncbi:hypothetical protein BMS3Bbin11_00429 [bacterium BMS3Bbin11]|nr:hypothetical protein BMS3Bbin11_00429 [bacterium BMS3Bbin11]